PACQFIELSAIKRLLQGAPVVSGPANVESYREAVADGDLLTTSHDGYLGRFGVVHRRVLMISQDGGRLDGEDTIAPAPGTRIKGAESDFALRFHLHPAVKASRLSDARGVMLVLPNRDVWTFEALDDKVDLEDSVFLARNDEQNDLFLLMLCSVVPGGTFPRNQTWSMQRSAARTAAPPIPARYFAMTLFQLPAGPRPRSPGCSEFRASTFTTSWENESRYLPPSRYASASFSATARESGAYDTWHAERTE